MKIYRIAWTIAVGALVARGLVLGAQHHPALTGLALLGGAAVAAGTALGSIGSPGRRVRRDAGRALAAGAAAGAVVGHLPQLGGGLVVIAILVAGTAPATVSAYERWAGSTGRSSSFDALVRGLAHAAPGYVPPSPLSELTDEELWGRWSATETALDRATSSEDVLDLVSAREYYLDELDRRDPQRVAALLTAGLNR